MPKKTALITYCFLTIRVIFYVSRGFGGSLVKLVYETSGNIMKQY